MEEKGGGRDIKPVLFGSRILDKSVHVEAVARQVQSVNHVHLMEFPLPELRGRLCVVKMPTLLRNHLLRSWETVDGGIISRSDR